MDGINRSAVLAAMRGAWVTCVIMLLMLGVTVAGFYLSNNWSQISSEALLTLGGNAPLVTLDSAGQWRLLAAKLQLGSWRSVAVFLPFFWVVGAAFERRHGSLALAVTFVLGSVLTSATTLYLTKDPGRISIGAGGPALGLLTCMLVTLALDGRLKDELQRWRYLAAIPYLLLTIDAISRGAADVYSLGCGAAFGLVVAAVLFRPGRLTAGGARLAALTLLAGGAAGVVLWQTPRPAYFLSEARAFQDATVQYAKDVSGLEGQLALMTDAAMKGQLTQEQLGARAEKELVPQWRELESRWLQRSFNPAVPGGDKLEHMKAYLSHRRQFVEASAQGWRTGNAQALEQANAHLAKAEAARAAMSR